MALQNSLENITTIKQSENQIKLMLQSPKLTTPIILVEGTDDSTFYRKHLNARAIVLVPINDKGNGNCHTVTQVTSNLHNEFTRCNVIGIRDKDYTEYEHTACPPSDWVLFSDGHSLECMLLMSENVQTEFKRCLPQLGNQFIDIINDCKHIAHYYIYNAKMGLDFSFNKNKMRLIHYYDCNTRRMKDSWKDLLQSDYTRKCKAIPFSEIQQELAELNIVEKRDWDICRGHDIVDVCYDIGKARGIEKKDLIKQMINAYTFEDFLRTSVSNRLRFIESNRNIQIINSNTTC